MTRAVDFANYTAVPTPEQVRCWLNMGITLAIIGTSYGQRWQQQVAVCEMNGMDVHEYQFPARLHATHRKWWLDVESNADGTRGTNEAEVRRICQQIPPYGIYTGRGEWAKNCGSYEVAKEFPFLKLFDASYARNPGEGSIDDAPPAFVPYAGFTSRAIHQYAANLTICGLNVDISNVLQQEQGGGRLATLDDDDKRAIADIVRAEVLKAIGTLPDGNGDKYKQNMVDLAHAGANRTVDAMVKAGQVKPPKE